MIITFRNYRIIPESGGYNLSKIVHRAKLDENKNPTKETYDDEKKIGYGFRLENLLIRIINDIAENTEVTKTLKEYKIWYSAMVEELKTILHD